MRKHILFDSKCKMKLFLKVRYYDIGSTLPWILRSTLPTYQPVPSLLGRCEPTLSYPGYLPPTQFDEVLVLKAGEQDEQERHT